MKISSPPVTGLLLTLMLGAPLFGVDRAEVARRVEAIPSVHPRIILNEAGQAALTSRIAAEPALATLHKAMLAEADRQLTTAPVERVLIGRRLLDKSRTALSRVLHLSLAWRLTGRDAYLARARAELLAVAKFSDWNPSHFLDVAEMTTAVGLGYDWLHAALDEPTRLALRTAIVEKGLKPSLQTNSWTRQVNNWNQVCNAGMTVGALAVAKTDQALAIDLITRAIETVPRSMHEYAPDGAYPEGPGYWDYGTNFNIVLISALESALGTDFGLSAQPGFLTTADYYLHVMGPSGYFFNYSDAGRGGNELTPAMFWFAAKRQQPYLLWPAWSQLSANGSDVRRFGRGRLDPLALLWFAPPATPPAAPTALSWTGAGPNPVAFHRSSWEADATFVGIKGGSASLNHAHMDVGTFVMDALGLRWADDLGSQDYNSLESKGVDLWNKSAGSERWKVFRLGTSSHNVLQVDGKQQNVSGDARFALAKPGRTVVNLDEIYAGQLAAARRGIALQTDRSVRIQDEFTSADQTADVRWVMVTRAEVAIQGPGMATLQQSGQTLAFRVLEPNSAQLEVFPTDPPPGKNDASNPGTRLIGFKLSTPARTTARLVVELQPAVAQSASAPVTPLDRW